MPEGECCEATIVLRTNVALQRMAMVFDDQDNNRSGVMRVYAKTAHKRNLLIHAN